MPTTTIRAAAVDCGDYIDTTVYQVQTDDTGAIVYQTTADGQPVLDQDGQPQPIILAAWDEIDWKPGTTGANQQAVAATLDALRPVLAARAADPATPATEVDVLRFLLGVDRTQRGDYTGAE